MTKFDFSEMIDRRHTNSVKWDVQDHELPMWVADMDFRTAPGIVKAIQDKAATGIFGYEEVPAAYFEAVQHWYATEHNWAPNTAWMRFVTGVVPAISSAVRRVSNVGDNVLVQAPVYNIFYNSIVNNGRHILSSDLVDRDGVYTIDWADLTAKMADPLTTMMILCNPHNPVGKVWTTTELAKIGELAAANHVTVLSDEIHGDITDELAEPNSFAVPGVIAAYTTGAAWVHAMNAQITANKQALTQYIQKHIPELRVIEGHATYLVWIDCRAVTHDTTALCRVIRAKTGLFITAGAVYGGDGHDFVRINVACPAKRLQDGLHRLAQGVTDFQAYA